MKHSQLLLTFISLLFTATGTRAQVVGQTFTMDNCSYLIRTADSETNSYTVRCTAITKTGEVTIPSEVVYGDHTFTVTEFGGSVSATILHIPETVTTLDGNWVQSSNLTDVYIPKSVTSISESYVVTRYSNAKLKNIHVDTENPNFMDVDGCLYTKDSSGNPTYLRIIPIASWSTRNNAFTIPDGVTDLYIYLSSDRSVGDQNKTMNNNLKSLTLPSTFTGQNIITTIGKDCYNLEEYVMPTASTKYSVQDGVLLNNDATEVCSYPQARTGNSYTVPSGVTNVPANAFTYVKNLETLTMPSSLTEMKTNAINNCSALVTLDLSQTQLTTLPANAITNCANLTNILLPTGMDIGDLLEKKAITGCPNVEFSVNPDDPNYATDENGILFKKDANGNKIMLIQCPASFTGDADGSYTVPATVTSISDNAFKSTKLKEIHFASSDNLTTIGESAFTGSTTLATIQIPRSVTTLKGSIFSNCTALANLSFEEGTTITSLPSRFVYGCSKLVSFTIPESVTILNQQAFCSSGITSITIPDNVTTIYTDAFQYMPALQSIHIGKNVNNLWGNHFYLSSNLKTITFAEDCKITSIGNGIYLYTSTLEVPKSVTTIGKIYGNSVSKIVIPEGSKLTSFVPELASSLTTVEGLENATGLTSIAANQFLNYSKLTSLHFPSSITTIGSRAFEGCANLTEITFGTTENPAQIQTIGQATFANCGITSFDIPASVQSVGKEAFLNCTSLTEVNIGSVMSNLDPEAFKGCTSLTAYHVDENNITYADCDGYLTDKDKTTLFGYPQGRAASITDFTLLPPSLTAIGRYAFYGNDQVEKVILPANITSIGTFAFLHDTGLRSLIFMGQDLIDPDNIRQGVNDMAFDYPGISDAITDNIMDDITICLTQSAYRQWTAAQAEGAGNKYYDYYSKFKAIETTFTAAASSATDEEVDEFMPVGENEVSLLSTTSKAETYVLPAAVVKDSKTYRVTMIGDYAFENASSNMREVVVKGSPEYIGTLAFATNITRDGSGNVTNASSTIEDIVFTTTTPAQQLSSVEFGLTAKYREFLDDISGGTLSEKVPQRVYVKRSTKEAYQTAWAKYADQIGTDLPLKAINNKYATFTREFDININPKTGDKPKGENWNTAKNCPYVIAYTAGKYGSRKNKDTGETEYVVRMTSINDPNGPDTDNDGTYIPANTGVLLEHTAGALGGGEGLTYTIGEADLESYSGENLMQPVAERTKNGVPQYTDVEGDNWTNFFISGGYLWPVGTDAINMPVHTSYLTVKVPEGVQAVRMVFFDLDNDNEATGIETVETATETDNEPIYNLSGRRVDSTYKGLVIKGGKKVWMK